jgi:hypothetical protein
MFRAYAISKEQTFYGNEISFITLAQVGIVKIVAGEFNSYALMEDGTLWAWEGTTKAPSVMERLT